MQVLIGQLRNAAAARRACQKTNLQKIRFINVFQRNGLLADGRGQCLKAHRAAAVVFHNGGEHAAVDGVKPQTVDLELAERVVGSLGGDHAVVADLRAAGGSRYAASRANGTRSPARRRARSQCPAARPNA